MRGNFRNLLTVGACLLAGSALAGAQTAPVTCGAASLTGGYSLVLSGRDVLSTAVLSKVAVSVGTATFDGVGKVTFNLTTDTNSPASATQTMAGTYTIPSNCVGTLNISTGDTASFTLLPYNTGKNFTITGQDATYSFTGSGATQPTACLTSTLSGGYGFSGTGYALSAGVITGVNSIAGLLQFDGAGNMTGNWSIASNGASFPASITGHYTVSSCVASATVADSNGVAYTMAFTVTSADGANISMLASSAPTLFTGTGHSSFTNPGVAVENAAGISGGTPPGSLFSIYGSGMSVGQAQTTSLNWPTTLGSAMVYVNGELAPLYYADNSIGLINAQMPLDITPGVAKIVVMNGAAASNAAAITVPATANPGVFIYGSNHAVAQNYPSFATNSPSAPAPVGSLIIVYFTGGGPVEGASSLVTGHPTPSSASYPVTEPYSATIAGVPATVQFVGLTATLIGVYQANIIIPSVAAGSRTLVLTVGGNPSNGSVVSVQ